MGGFFGYTGYGIRATITNSTFINVNGNDNVECIAGYMYSSSYINVDNEDSTCSSG